jgi:hypothetical protein
MLSLATLSLMLSAWTVAAESSSAPLPRCPASRVRWLAPVTLSLLRPAHLATLSRGGILCGAIAAPFVRCEAACATVRAVQGAPPGRGPAIELGPRVLAQFDQTPPGQAHYESGPNPPPTEHLYDRADLVSQGGRPGRYRRPVHARDHVRRGSASGFPGEIFTLLLFGPAYRLRSVIIYSDADIIGR